MKVIVLHGTDATNSYLRFAKFVNTAKSRGWEIIYDSLPETPSLFGKERLIIFRDYKVFTALDIKNVTDLEGTLIIYSDSEIPLTFLKKMPKDFKMEKYDLPKVLFIFLENIYPGNSEVVIKMFHSLLTSEPVELLFYFIAKHLRDLVWVLTDASSTGFPGWKASKLTSQAKKFKKQQIANIISKLCEIDIKVKSSKSDLIQELDLLLIRELE